MHKGGSRGGRGGVLGLQPPQPLTKSSSTYMQFCCLSEFVAKQSTVVKLQALNYYPVHAKRAQGGRVIGVSVGCLLPRALAHKG